MRIAVFSTRRYDGDFLERANAAHGHELVFLDARLDVVAGGLVAWMSGGAG